MPKSAPVSFGQMGIYGREQSFENDAACIRPVLYRLEGTVDVAGLQLSLNEIVRRHEVLRTTYHVENGVPVQMIHPARPVSLAMMDLRSMPEYERETRARQLAVGEARRRFNMSHDLMLRAALLRL